MSAQFVIGQFHAASLPADPHHRHRRLYPFY
jgi:hypothetical protein